MENERSQNRQNRTTGARMGAFQGWSNSLVMKPTLKNLLAKTLLLFTLDPKHLKNMAKRVDLNKLLDYEAHCQLHPLITALRKKKRIIVIAGAGISASTGSK
jgi:hypothetical protein